MRYALGLVAVIFWFNALDEAHAKQLDLGVKTPEYMRATCAKVRGIYVDNEGKMSCVFPKGTVRCNAEHHCFGFPRHARPSVQPGNPGGVVPVPLAPMFPDWQYHGDKYRC